MGGRPRPQSKPASDEDKKRVGGVFLSSEGGKLFFASAVSFGRSAEGEGQGKFLSSHVRRRRSTAAAAAANEDFLSSPGAAEDDDKSLAITAPECLKRPPPPLFLLWQRLW